MEERLAGSKAFKSKAIAILTTTLLGLAAGPSVGRSDTTSKCGVERTSRILEELLSDKPGPNRYIKAENLTLRLKKLGPDCVTNEHISTMIELLHDDADSMRVWAAAMIWNAGPAGRRAIPALWKAFADAPCEYRSLTSASVIRNTLIAFGENPPPVPRCARQ